MTPIPSRVRKQRFRVGTSIQAAQYVLRRWCDFRALRWMLTSGDNAR